MIARTASIRIEHETLEKLDRLARSTGRPRSWIVNRAIEQYVDHEDWFVAEVGKGIAAADRGELIQHDRVVAEARRRIAENRKPR